MARRPTFRRVKQASQAEKREQRNENDRPWTDREKALLIIKYLFKNDEAYNAWFASVFDRYFRSDPAKYEDELAAKYRELVTDQALQEIQDILANFHKNKQDLQELIFLRRIHGQDFARHPDELEILRRRHERWMHPARSDLRKYTKRTVYWNGDL